MQLRDTFINKVYCQKHNPERPPNDFNFQIHFVWNKYKRKMIPIDNIYYITDGSARITNNEFLQSVIQEYEFTHIDHIYSKNNKKYTYNNRTLKFDEIPNLEDFEIKCLENQTNISINRACDIGPNEKCKSCDLIHQENCGECNEGYYLSEEDKTICTKCSMEGCRTCPNDICNDCFNDTQINYPNISNDEEVRKKVMTDLMIRETYVNKIYCYNYWDYLSNGLKIMRHCVWNKYKRKMIEIVGLLGIDSFYSIFAYNKYNQSYECSGEVFNDEYFQSVRQGYEFTFVDHIYEKIKNIINIIIKL